MNLFNGAEAEDGDVEVARDALQLAQAEAMGGSHDGEALVVKPLALEGLAPGDFAAVARSGAGSTTSRKRNGQGQSLAQGADSQQVGPAGRTPNRTSTS